MLILNGRCGRRYNFSGRGFSFFYGVGFLLVVALCNVMLFEDLCQAKTANQIPSKNAIQQGQTLFETRCINCHSLPLPTSHSLAQWPGILNRMAPRAYLKPSEQQAVFEYLKATLQLKKKHS